MKDKRIELIVDREAIYGRDVLRGVVSYASHSNKPWSIHINKLSLRRVNSLKSFPPAGIIAQVHSENILNALQNMNCPFVDVSNAIENKQKNTVCANSIAIGEVAAEHFLNKGFRNFAYYGGNKMAFSKFREIGFANDLNKKGFQHAAYYGHIRINSYETQIESKNEKLSQWLKSLTKPIAVFACNDTFAMVLADACHNLEIKVPEKVAIIGVDNDELFCTLRHPTISSISLPIEQIGYKAAEILDNIMLNKLKTPQSFFFPPKNVVTRVSSDILAIENEELVAALRFIQKHVSDPITVEDVCDHIMTSRRSLEKWTKKELGRSPLAEIHRVHIEHAKNLLCGTNKQITNIAVTSGYSCMERFSVVFRKKTGFTPTRYRQLYQHIK